MTPLTTADARAAITADTFAIATALAKLGLTQERVLSYFGLSHPAALSYSERRVRQPVTEAAIPIVLFTTAHGVELERAERALGPTLAHLLATKLLFVHRRRVKTRAVLLPTSGGLIVLDHTELAQGAVSFPDDSSYHLLGCMPARAERWLDVGTGNGFLAMARGRERVLGTDVHERGLAFAELGAHLSGRRDDRFELADCCEPSGPFDLVTFNAPLPHDLGPQSTAYRRASDAELLPRFWRQVVDRIEPTGEVLVHCSLPGDAAPLVPTVGDSEVLCYTPTHSSLDFGVIRWRPSKTARARFVRCELAPDHPHLTRSDFGEL